MEAAAWMCTLLPGLGSPAGVKGNSEGSGLSCWGSLYTPSLSCLPLDSHLHQLFSMSSGERSPAHGDSRASLRSLAHASASASPFPFGEPWSYLLPLLVLQGLSEILLLPPMRGFPSEGALGGVPPSWARAFPSFSSLPEAILPRPGQLAMFNEHY